MTSRLIFYSYFHFYNLFFYSLFIINYSQKPPLNHMQTTREQTPIHYIYAVGAQNIGLYPQISPLRTQINSSQIVQVKYPSQNPNSFVQSPLNPPFYQGSPEKIHNMNNTIDYFSSNKIVYPLDTNFDASQQVSPPVIDQSCLGTLKKHKWIVLGVCIVVILTIIAIVLGVHYGTRINNDTTSEFVFTCDAFPGSCTGVKPQVVNFVASTYKDPDQAQSVLQTSKSFELLPDNMTASSIPRQNYTEYYRNITRSVECMALTLPNDFAEAFQKLSEVQLTTQTELDMYTRMMESFSGQPLRMTSTANLQSTCKFNLTATARRRLQQVPKTQANQSCVSNATSVLIYFSGVGYSPSSVIQNVYKMQEILSTNSSTNFEAGIIALGAWRRDSYLGYYSTYISSFESYYSSKGYAVPSRLNLYYLLRVVLNLCRYNYCLPSGISSSTFYYFWNYYIGYSLRSFINEASYWQYARHMDFVVNQINQGKKVTLIAHGQGAYYANKVYSLLSSTQKTYVSLVYVAPTVESMADGSTNYITNPNDGVINQIRTNSQTNTSIPSPLPSNVFSANFSSEVDLGSHHELPGYALAYKDKLTELIVSAKSRAAQPSRTMGNGLITITLTWDTQPDIDLHILEPGGTHVYFGNKRGNNGYLDVDDTSKYGPQHYYTNCTLAQGTYTVYIYFYSGSAASTTITTVSAGQEYFMKTITLNPYFTRYVCDILVSYDNSTSSYTFAITPRND